VRRLVLALALAIIAVALALVIGIAIAVLPWWMHDDRPYAVGVDEVLPVMPPTEAELEVSRETRGPWPHAPS
jgi:hypothetical protein